MKFLLSLTSLAVFLVAEAAAAEVPVWGQCGGGSTPAGTTCASGSICKYVNEYYSQCIPGTAPVTSSTTTLTSAGPGATTVPGTCPGPRQKFKYFGVNQAGAEFGEKVLPGELGTHYIWPERSSVDFFLARGLTTQRIAFKVERLSPNGLTGPFNPTYLAALKDIVGYVTSKGGYAVLDPHNYLRYFDVMPSQADFAAWWKLLSAQFINDANVVFDLQNEPYGFDAVVVFGHMQAAVNAIRAGGATQMILVEGTSWSGAHSWVTSGNGPAFAGLKDPSNNIAITMHQYLDADHSGTNPVCVSPTIGAERIVAATAWLKANNFKGLLGEYGGGNSATCIEAVKSMLCSMQQPGSPWIGALYWAAGPWWGNYFTSIEPNGGAAVATVLPQAILPFV